MAELTKQAMTGTVLFQDALEARLQAMQISKNSLEKFVESDPFTLSDGVEQLLERLQSKKVPIYIISGSFIEAIVPTATRLGIPRVCILLQLMDLLFMDL